MSTNVAVSSKTQSAQAPSTTFAFRRLGPRGATPLVLFNRFRGTLDTWDPGFLDLLASERDVILFDNIGIGYTPGEAGNTVDAYAAGGIEFITALGLDQVDVLGWSLGGAVAQVVALKRPDLVRRMIVAGSGPGTIPDLPPIDPRVFEIMANPDATIEDQNFLFYPETPEARDRANASNARVSTRLSTSTVSVSDEAAQRQFEALAAFFLAGQDGVYNELGRLDKPVLYANGSRDVMMSPYASYAAVQRLPHATLVLYSDAGHAFLFQHPEDFAGQVHQFLGTAE
ncbi:alpha/beta fold hydrolase [Streptomyces mirabilis]|uniref:alpha/beta fold hydrolase n=1 Tax=Streptomyces mirabilis TaxID=68239 RepID=UPI00369A96B6